MRDDEIRVPCRWCGCLSLRARLHPGRKLLHCGECGKATEIHVYEEEGERRVKTAPVRSR